MRVGLLRKDLGGKNMSTENFNSRELSQLGESIGHLSKEYGLRGLTHLSKSDPESFTALARKVNLLSRDAAFFAGMVALAGLLAEPEKSRVNLPSGETIELRDILEDIKPGVTSRLAESADISFGQNHEGN